jgi:hypothetical protein
MKTTRMKQLPTIRLAYVLRFYDALGRQLGQAAISYRHAQTASEALPGRLEMARQRNTNICRGEVVCVYA